MPFKIIIFFNNFVKCKIILIKFKFVYCFTHMLLTRTWKQISGVECGLLFLSLLLSLSPPLSLEKRLWVIFFIFWVFWASYGNLFETVSRYSISLGVKDIYDEESVVDRISEGVAFQFGEKVKVGSMTWSWIAGMFTILWRIHACVADRVLDQV